MLHIYKERNIPIDKIQSLDGETKAGFTRGTF